MTGGGRGIVLGIAQWLMKSPARPAIGMLLATSLLAPLTARGDIKPHSLIADGMELQQRRNIRLWGTADAGEKVSVEFRGQSVSATAESNGRWELRLKSKAAGGPFSMRLAGKMTISLTNVLVGEVWVASLLPQSRPKGFGRGSILVSLTMKRSSLFSLRIVRRKQTTRAETRESRLRNRFQHKEIEIR